MKKQALKPQEAAECLLGVCNAMYIKPFYDLVPDLCEALQGAYCTDSYIDYLLTYQLPEIGFCEGDQFSDTRPEEFAERYLGVDRLQLRWGVFAGKKKSEYREGLLLYRYLRTGFVPGLDYISEERECEVAQIHWNELIQTWREEFQELYGHSVELSYRFYAAMSREERLAV